MSQGIGFLQGRKPGTRGDDELWKEPWFTANTATAADFIESDVYDFYIDVFVYNYRVEKLTDREREHMMESYEEIRQILEERYGGRAYEIYFDSDHCAAYYGGE